MALLTNGDQDSMMSDINVTPLVDVMLVLLTVFIVTAPLLMNAVPVKLPKATASPSVSQLKTARISITQEGQLYYDANMLTQPQLEAKLMEQGNSKALSLEIHADEKVEYGRVAQVMAAIQRAGIVKFSFVTLPSVKAH